LLNNATKISNTAVRISHIAKYKTASYVLQFTNNPILRKVA